MSKEIEIQVNTDGTINIDMIGYKGTECSLDLKKIANEIGSIVSSEKKPEFFQNTVVKNINKVKE